MKIFFSENDIPKLVIDNALSEEFVEIAILLILLTVFATQRTNRNQFTEILFFQT